MKPANMLLVLLTTLFLSGCAALSTAGGAGGVLAAGAAGEMTIGSVLDDLQQKVSRIVYDVDTVAGRQQMILAETLRSTIAELQKAYSTSLDQTVSSLSSTEYAAVQHLQSLVNNSISDANTAVEQRITQAQSAANQILDKIPFVRKQPIVLAVRVKAFDLASDANGDIEVLGYRLADPDLKYKKPLAKIGGITIPPENIVVVQDRMTIRLPEDAAKKVQSSIDPCRASGVVPFEFTFYQRKSFLIFTSAEPVPFSGFVGLEEKFTATTAIDYYPAVETITATHSISNSQHLTVAQGGFSTETEHTSVTITVPTEATIQTHNANWGSANANASGIDSVTVNGRLAVASGWLQSRSGWHGRAWGDLSLTVNYTQPEQKNQAIPSVELTAMTFGKSEDGLTHPSIRQSISTANSRPKNVTCTFRRKGCKDVYDKLMLDLDNSIPMAREQDSGTGRFHASYRDGQFEVSEK